MFQIIENACVGSLRSTLFVVFLSYAVLYFFFCVRDNRKAVICALPVDHVDCLLHFVHLKTKSSFGQSGHSSQKLRQVKMQNQSSSSHIMILIVPMLTTMFLQGREGTVVFEIGTTFSFIENNLFDCYIQMFQQHSYQASESFTC